MSGEGGAIAEVLAAAIDAEWMRPEHGCNGDPDACYRGSCPVPAYGRMGLDELRDSAVTGLLASPALADLLAAERQRGREEALREAAKEAEERGDIGKDGGCEAWTWLRIRADRIAETP